jgi:hypothetical protein
MLAAWTESTWQPIKRAPINPKQAFSSRIGGYANAGRGKVLRHVESRLPS